MLRGKPLDLSADRLRGLRLSLNTPVVSIEELPVEPARAAIAIHDEIDGRPNVTVGVCSLQSRVAVLFSFEGDLHGESASSVGLDAALSFGESMGFLFDEDELEADSGEEVRSRVLNLWLELIGPTSGETDPDPQTAAVPAEPQPAPGTEDDVEAEPQGDEVLLLDEMADFDDDLPDVRAGEPGGVDSAAPVPLSKFRHSAPSQSPCPCDEEERLDVGESLPAAKGAALGRVKLVKRRQGTGQALSKPSVIRRLLSSF